MEPPQLPSDEDIIAAFDEYSSLPESDRCLMYPSRESPIAVIKHDSKHFGIVGEARNQQYAFEALEKVPEQDRRGIRVPRIYRVIERLNAIFIVMEYIPRRTLLEIYDVGDCTENQLQGMYDQIEKALKLFLSFKVPDDTPPGPAGGGIIRHPMFKYTSASAIYNSVDELQDHLMKVANCRKGNDGNFIFTDAGELCVIDFNHASFAPLSFMTYAFDQPRLVCQIKGRFDLPQGNLEGMRAAGYYFLISWRGIGLDNYDRHAHAVREYRIAAADKAS